MLPEFSWQVRVYYEDTDAAGVVYHSNYLKFMERARTEWLREAGYSQQILEKEEGIVFVVARIINMEFLRPARFDELLHIHSKLVGTGAARLEFEQTVFGESAVPICRATVHIVCIDPITFKPKKIPNKIKAKLTNDV